MSEVDFDHRPRDLTLEEQRAALRATLDRAIADIDRLCTLPAGHEDVLRAWGMDEKVPMPVWFVERFGKEPWFIARFGGKS